MVVEGCGRNLATGIAVDAGGVHEEVAGNVLREPQAGLGHKQWMPRGAPKLQPGASWPLTSVLSLW